MATRKPTRQQLEDALKSSQQELPVAHLRAFESAKHSRRTENWWTPNRGPNADLRPALETLTRRHQDLIDSNPWAHRAINVIANNWIGDGIIGSPVGGTKKYGSMWADWCDSTECDWDGKLNFYGLQSLIARTTAARGSCLIRPRLDESMPYGLAPLRLQVMEPDYLDLSKDDGGRIRFGKQYTEDGRLEGYWLRRSHPGESSWLAGSLTSDFVPASEIIHTYDVLRPQQATGIPWGSAVLVALRDIDDIASAQMLKSKIAACFTAFVYSNEQPDVPTSSVLTETMEPGAIEILPDGKDIKFSQPPQSPDFVTHNRFYLNSIAAGYGITFEALTGIYTEVNFSSGRMGWIEFHRNIAAWRWNLTIPQVLAPIYRRFTEAARLNQVRGPTKITWTPPRREMIDPSKETAGLIDAVQAGFMSLSDVQRSLGYIPQEVIDELALDKTTAEASGLTLTVFGTGTN